MAELCRVRLKYVSGGPHGYGKPSFEGAMCTVTTDHILIQGAEPPWNAIPLNDIMQCEPSTERKWNNEGTQMIVTAYGIEFDTFERHFLFYLNSEQDMTILASTISTVVSAKHSERNLTRYTVTSRVALAEKEPTREKPILGIILVPLVAGGVAGGVSDVLYTLPLSGLLSCVIGWLHILLIVIAGLIAAWYSGHVRSGAIAGAIWGVVVLIFAFLRSGKDLSALSPTSILPIALILLLGPFLGLVGGSFSQR